MKNKKKTPEELASNYPGKRRKVKVLFYDFIRIPGKRQLRTLSWGKES